MALSETAQATELRVVAAQRALLATRNRLGLLSLLLLMLVLMLRKHRLLLVLQVGMVFPGRGLGVFWGEDDENAGRDLVVDDGFVIFTDNVDTELDNVFRLELARLRLDRFGR